MAQYLQAVLALLLGYNWHNAEPVVKTVWPPTFPPGRDKLNSDITFSKLFVVYSTKEKEWIYMIHVQSFVGPKNEFIVDYKISAKS